MGGGEEESKEGPPAFHVGEPKMNYALPCLGGSGSQAGWASFTEKKVESCPMPRGQTSCWEGALRSIGLSTSFCLPGHELELQT